jgi:8-oxo-dGTP pyrophosphatase MutT (NUDIX family)
MRPILNSVAAIIADGKHRVLLQKRDVSTRIYYPGFWGLFGGAIDGTEAPIDAVAREIKEEIGLGNLKFKYFLEFEFACPLFDGMRHRRLVFLTSSEESILQTIELNEGVAARLFSFADLPAMTNLVSFDAAALSMYYNLSIKKNKLSPIR